jgi:hypothetical protein
MLGPFLDSTDGNTVEGSLTITQPDIRLSKNGGGFAQKSAAQTLSHNENGWYPAALSATDTGTLGILIVAVHESGALPVWREFMVVPANEYDSLVLGSDNLDVEIASMAANVLTATAIASNAITSAKIADGALTAAKFAAGAFDAVWSVAARLLTAGTNIVLAKGTGVTGFNDLSAAQANAEVVDALATDTYAEPGQGAPPATASLAAKIGYLYKGQRNKQQQTATEYRIFNDAGDTVDQKASFSDDGTTAERGELVTGP